MGAKRLTGNDIAALSGSLPAKLRIASTCCDVIVRAPLPSPPETFHSPLETQHTNHTPAIRVRQTPQESGHKEKETLGRSTTIFVKHPLDPHTENEKSKSSPPEPRLHLTMEDQNDSHLRSQSFLQGETTLETDSLFEEQDKDHQRHQNVTKTLTSTTTQAPPPTHLEPYQAHLAAQLDLLETPAYLHPSQTPRPAPLDSPQAPPPADLDSPPPAHRVRRHPAPLLANLDPHQTPPPAHPEPLQTATCLHLNPHLPAHLHSHQTPPPAHLDPLLTTTPAHLEPQLPAHLDPHPAPLPADLAPLQTPPPICTYLEPHPTSTSAYLHPHAATLPAHLDPPQTFTPTDLEPHPTSTSAYVDPHQTCTPAHLDSHQAPPPVHLDTSETAPAYLDTQKVSHLQQTPSIAHLDTQLPAHLSHHQALLIAQLLCHQTTASAHLDPSQTVTQPHLDPHQASLTAQLDSHPNPTPAQLEPRKTPPPAHLDPYQAPLTAHLDPRKTLPPAQPDPKQTLTLAHLDPHQAPPTAHLDPQQSPLPVHLEPPDAPNFLGSSGEPKLCGFLQKQGGPLRAWKRRWFTYEEKQNQMFYYRSPQDVTPLGRVDLSSATFTYPLKAEMGTFNIETPERTYTLKAVTQDLMLYWLQQLQLKRWHHRQNRRTSGRLDIASKIADDFLPPLKSPAGLVGEEAANETPQRMPLANMSIKHPFIQIQNTVHSLRKRSSQEWAQSVFYAQAPAEIQLDATANGAASVTIPPSGPVGQTSPGGATGALLDAPRRKKNLSSSKRSAVVSSETLSRLQQDKDLLMEEVKAQKELVWLLHKTLEAAQREKRTCADFVAAEGEQERLELLRHRERQVADLLGRMERAQAAAEAARRDLDQRDQQVAQLRDEVRKLSEKNKAKREVIIKLSDHVAACVSNPPSSTSSTCTPDSFRHLQQRVEDLKDDIEAYKTQNKFLNSEIFQLTKLWRKSSEQERSLMVKCAYLEACHCQAESRYLGVLRKLQEIRSLDPDQRRTIQKMVEDALQGQAKNIKAATNGLHDEYGFKIVPDYEVEDVKLLAKIQALEIRSHNLLQQEGRERPLLSRWAQYLASRSDDDFCPSPELKGLLRAGVPQEYRQRVWRCLVRVRTRAARDCHPQRYQQLCDKSHTCPHPASRQIQLDLHRTLTSNRNFSSPSSPAHQQLQRILLAFSWQNPSIGYCQGLNRLAAIALVVLQSEEEAFWCLVAVVDAIMPPDYYTKNLLAAQADQQVLKDFLMEKLPRLAAHFDLHGIDVSLVTFNWFLVVFVESLPSDILLPLWDAFLYEGTKVMFRYALALFKYKEDDILKIHDSVDIYQYLRFFTKTVTDARKLMGMAFVDMNPFPGRLLKSRRALHLERLQGELRELEEQQREFAELSADWSQQRQQRHGNQMDNVASEDDEEMG